VLVLREKGIEQEGQAGADGGEKKKPGGHRRDARGRQAGRQGVTESAVSSAPSSLRKAVPSHGLRDRRYSSSFCAWAS
jgi:hypothetical protein